MKKTKQAPRLFTATLEKPDDGMDTAFISIPYSVEQEYGTKGQVKVKATFDGQPYRGVLANMGTGCHVIIVRKDVRAAIGKKVGDQVKVTIERDFDVRIVDIPDDLKKILKSNPKAEKFYHGLSYTNRKEYAAWIHSAKRPETKKKRFTQVIPMLLRGKKNPTEK